MLFLAAVLQNPLSAMYLPSIAAMSAGFEGWDEDLLEAYGMAETIFWPTATCLRKEQDINRRAEAALRLSETCLRKVQTPHLVTEEMTICWWKFLTSLHSIMSLYEKIDLKGIIGHESPGVQQLMETL